jgi:hypothetical protein
MKSHTRKASATAATVLLATFSFAGISARAAEEKKPFVLTAIVNGAGGESLVAGNYELALKQIKASKYNTIVASTIPINLCVAHTAMRNWSAARAACDAAVNHALSTSPRSSYGDGLSAIQDHRNTIAIAYSNRAVVNWLSKETVAAAEDLAKAHKLAPDAQFIASNIEAFKAPRDVAQVAIVQ